MADYADDHNWDTFGAATVSAKAAQALQRAKGEEQKPGSTKEDAAAKFRELQKKVETTGQKAESEAKSTLRDIEAKAAAAAATVKAKATETKDAIVAKTQSEAATLRERATEATEKVKAVAGDVETKASEAVAKAGDAVTHAKAKVTDAASDAQAKATETASSVKAKAVEAESKIAEGAKRAARDAEAVVNKGEAKVQEAAHKVEDAAHKVKQAVDETPGPRGYLDAQRPRELRPETVTPAKPTFEGKTVYSGPPLPVGHEPPPGFYIPPPAVPKVKEGAEKVKETLPLLAPKVKEFAAEEPIVEQLASTIDSLASSLSTPNAGDSNKILSKAQDDLTALTQRLSDVKKAEKAKLEKTVGEKVKEFEAVLKSKEQERAQGEQGLKESWEKEKSRLVDDWRKSLETELESQRQGIEQR